MDGGEVVGLCAAEKPSVAVCERCMVQKVSRPRWWGWQGLSPLAWAVMGWSGEGVERVACGWCQGDGAEGLVEAAGVRQECLWCGGAGAVGAGVRKAARWMLQGGTDGWWRCRCSTAA